MATLASGKLSEMLEDFLKSVVDRDGTPVYRSKISQLISSEGKSLVVDFGDLLKYNSDLANRLLLEPDSALASFKIAAFETMRSENALYADRVKRELTVRLRRLTDLVPLRKVDTSYIDRLIAVSGMVVRTSELRPLMTEGAWLCPSGHLTYQGQDDLPLKRPPKCELCGEVRNFELDRRHSRFIDFQIVRVQELPEELPPGQLPQFFDVNVEGDMVNTARPGDRVILTGVVRAVPDYSQGLVKTRLFRSQIDCNHVEVKGKEPEQVLLTKEDEALIKKVASSPDAYERLVSSIAPVILGHQPEKEAILLLLAGGSAMQLPDGTKLRGDLNVLFVGDPGCLVADERIALGNGAFAKIGEVGNEHLQRLNLQVLTGEGGARRAMASRFHIYRRQPILEIVTETGKSIKGTYNHPLLVVENDDGRLVRKWKRLDELRVGDRAAAATFIPCTITAYQPTGFKVFQPRRGPRFKGRVPSVVDKDLAGYMGYVLGDGWVDKYEVVATVAEPEIDLLPQLEGMVTRLFAVNPRYCSRLRDDRNVRTTDIYVNSECVAMNLAFLRERRVPRLIFVSGNEVVAEFLRWLFEADGTVFSKGRGRRAIGLKAKDVELLRDVQVLLLRWGIHSRIVVNALLIRRGEDIIRYAKNIGFASKKKSSKLELLAREALTFGRFHRQLSERVVRIRPGSPEDVYDIEVPDGHRFIANGLISHNTGKSEMLKFAAQVAPRGLYASGRGATAAGLTAAVIREKNVFMLEAGVVVLGDLGIACLAGDTEIYTGQSLVPIEKVWEETAGPVHITRTGREAKKLLLPVNIYDRKQRTDLGGIAHVIMRRRHVGEVVKLTFSSGLSVKVTPEHLLKRPTDIKNLWVRADQVRAGDELKAPVRVFGPAAYLEYSEEEAYAIGCTYGDGWLGPSGITISQSKTNADVVNAIVGRMPSTFAVYDKGDRTRQVGRYLLVSRMLQLFTTERGFVRKTRLLLRSPSVDNLLMLKERCLWAFFAGVFDTDGDVNHSKGRVVSLRIYPTKDGHELAVLLYALRRLGVYGRIHGRHSSIPVIQITGADISRFAIGIGPYSVKLRREPEEIVILHKGSRSLERGREKVVGVERIPFDGYVYDLSVGSYHNFETSLVYVHNCVDEFEKMKPDDRTALHEAMEQQSYHPSTEVMFANGQKARIGEFVDASIRVDPESVVKGKDCEVLPLRDPPRIHSVGPDFEIAEVSVDRVSRHLAPDHFYRIRHSNGRSVVVTPEHPVFVFRQGGIVTLPASEVRAGDFVPAPRRIPPSNQHNLLSNVATARNAKPVLQQTLLSPAFARILGYLITEGNFYHGRTAEIDFTNYDGQIMDDMRVCAGRIFGFKPIERLIGGKPVTLRYLSKVLYDYFERNFPGMVKHAREKRAPAQILAAGEEVIREFLAAAFLGDGSVETDAVCYRTSSQGLAEDYQDLLLRLGISSRIALDRSNDSYKVYVTGDALPRFFELVVEKTDKRYARIERLVFRGTANPKHHDVLPTGVARDVVSLYSDVGLAYNGRYRRNLNEGAGTRRDSLERDLHELEARSEILEAVVSEDSLAIRELRERCGWSQATIAGFAGLERREVDHLERGGYGEDERKRLEGLLRGAASEHLRRVRGDIGRLRRLQSLRFLRVSGVERLRNEGEWQTKWVYDVTVEPTHNFVANGVMLHNTVTVAKGGIYATLNARTAILAASNPVLGRYNPYQNLIENIGTLPLPLLSRFDLIFVFRDQPTPDEDERLASHILSVHARKSYASPPPVEFSLLKKYLTYAKRISPELTRKAMDRLKDYYLQLRKAGGSEDSIPPTPRTLEALIRVSTARARLLLKDEVTEEDALAAIALMNRMVEDVLTDTTTKKTDFGIQLGKPMGERKNMQTAMEVLKALEGTEKKPVERKTFKEELMKARFSDEDAEKMIRTMFREGMVYESKPGFLRRLGS